MFYASYCQFTSSRNTHFFLEDWCGPEEQYGNNAFLIIPHHLSKAKASYLESNIRQFYTTFTTPFKAVKQQLTKSKVPLDLHATCETKNHVAIALPEVITDAYPATVLQKSSTAHIRFPDPRENYSGGIKITAYQKDLYDLLRFGEWQRKEGLKKKKKKTPKPRKPHDTLLLAFFAFCL